MVARSFDIDMRGSQEEQMELSTDEDKRPLVRFGHGAKLSFHYGTTMVTPSGFAQLLAREFIGQGEKQTGHDGSCLIFMMIGRSNRDGTERGCCCGSEILEEWSRRSWSSELTSGC